MPPWVWFAVEFELIFATKLLMALSTILIHSAACCITSIGDPVCHALPPLPIRIAPGKWKYIKFGFFAEIICIDYNIMSSASYALQAVKHLYHKTTILHISYCNYDYVLLN